MNDFLPLLSWGEGEDMGLGTWWMEASDVGQLLHYRHVINLTTILLSRRRGTCPSPDPLTGSLIIWLASTLHRQLELALKQGN
jgi:hypothetical protein